LCVGADVSALAAGACALPLLRRAPAWPDASAHTAAFWHASLLLAAFAPLAWAVAPPRVIPAYVRSLSVAGEINVIEFSDFECPFCRALHPVLSAAIAPYGTRVHFVRKSFPLPGHVHSREAARAYLCAGAQGRGDAMADWLFAADDVSAASCTREAAALGLDLSQFVACVVDPATEATVARDAAAIESSDFRGLPTVWIGTQRILGYDRSAGAEPYATALARSASGDDTRPRIAPLAVVALLALLTLLPALRRR
jgi:predicted DsbA family dithiol-disulfide isomerase